MQSSNSRLSSRLIDNALKEANEKIEIQNLILSGG